MVRSSPRFLGIEKKAYNRFQELSRPWTPEELARDKKRVLRNRKKKRAKRQKEEKENREKAVEEAEKFLDEQSKLYERMICSNNKEFSSSLDRISSILIRQGAKERTKAEILKRLLSVDDCKDPKFIWEDPKFILTSIMEFLKSIKKYHSTYEQYCHVVEGESFEDPFGVAYRDPPQTRREFLQDNGLPKNEGVVRNLDKNVRQTNPGNKQIDPATLKALKEKRDELYIMSQSLSVALSSVVKGELYDVAMA